MTQPSGQDLKDEPLVAARGRLAGLGASTLRERAAAATRIARAEQGVIGALAKLAPPPRNREAVSALASAVGAERAAFAALAGAAGASKRKSYVLARGRIMTASLRVGAAVARLEPEGFKLPTPSSLTPPPLPPMPKPVVAASSSAPSTTAPRTSTSSASSQAAAPSRVLAPELH